MHFLAPLLEARKFFIGVFIAWPMNKVEELARSMLVYLGVYGFSDFIL